MSKNQTEATDQEATAVDINQKTVILDEPIKRGESKIDQVTLRKPAAGELRGVSLMDLAQLDVTALQRVLPRISNPTLTQQEVAGMEPSDLLEMGAVVAGFLLKKADRATAFQNT